MKPSKAEMLKYRFPDKELKKKYIILNIILCVLQGISILATIWMGIVLILSNGQQVNLTGEVVAEGQTANLIFGILFIALGILFFFLIFLRLIKFDNRAYSSIFILSLLGLKYSVVFSLICIFLAVFLRKKLFPELGWFRLVPKK